MLYRTPEELKRYLQTADMSEVCSQKFALTYGPMMAKSTELIATLELLCGQCIYYLPFKYGGYLLKIAKNCSAKQIKSYIREVTIDMDALRDYFLRSEKILADDLDNNTEPGLLEHFDIISDGLKELIKDTINHVRKYQRENGVTESAMTSYAPIVPYSNNMYKQWLETFWDRLAKARKPVATIESIVNPTDKYTIPQLISLYNEMYTGNMHNGGNKKGYLFDLLGHYLMKDLIGIIAESDILYHDLRSIHDVWKLLETDHEESHARNTYYAMIFLINQDDALSAEEIRRYIEGRDSILSLKMNTESDFNQAVESMNIKYDEKLIENMGKLISLEVMEYQQDRAKLRGRLFRNPAGNIFMYDEVFDLNQLLDQFSLEPHMECTQHCNEDFLEDMKDIITNYSFFLDDMLVAEVDGLVLAVPYEDNGDDSKHKVLYLNKEGELKVADSFERFHELFENRIDRSVNANP